MTVHNAVSGSITDYDASPRVMHTAGEGAAAILGVVDDYVTVPAAAAATSVFRIVRVKSNVKVKRVILENEAQGAGKVQVGVYYADTAADIAPGNSPNSGAVISVSLFSGDVDLTSAVLPKDVTNNSGSYTLDKRAQPLWQAAGLSSDPGGKFDICATVHTTDVTTGTGKLGLTVSFAEG